MTTATSILTYLQRAAAHGAAQEMGVLDFDDEQAPPELRNIVFEDGALHVTILEGDVRAIYRVDLSLVRVGTCLVNPRTEA